MERLRGHMCRVEWSKGLRRKEERSKGPMCRVERLKGILSKVIDAEGTEGVKVTAIAKSAPCPAPPSPHLSLYPAKESIPLSSHHHSPRPHQYDKKESATALTPPSSI